MFDYLQKFNSLPADLRARISSTSAMAAISDLENKYKVDLAALVMKIMVKSLAIKDLPAYFVSEDALSSQAAEALTKELKQRVFMSVADYLGLSADKRAFDLDSDIKSFINEAGIVLPSSVLVSRFKNIIATYLRGVRNRIDTKSTLAKSVKIGGLDLKDAEIDRILKLADQHELVRSPQLSPKPLVSAKVASLKTPFKPHPVASHPVVTKPVFRSEPSVPEYDLKKALKAGQVKKLNLEKPKERLDLPPAPEELDLPPATSAELSGPRPKTNRRPASSLSPLKKSSLKKIESSPTLNKRSKLQTKVEPIKPPQPGFWSRLNPFGHSGVSSAKSQVTPTKPRVAPAKTRVTPTKPQVAPTKSRVASDKPRVTPAKSSLSMTTPAPSHQIRDSKKKIVATSATSSFPAAARPAPSIASSRPKLHDIKPMPKVMGPLEELKFLDLVNFRRLGANPSQATAKILAKIKLLEKDGYDKMVAGVLAWRQSPVNRLYLHLGQVALNKDTTLQNLIAAHAADSNYLTWDEIQAIIKLNSRLSF